MNIADQKSLYIKIMSKWNAIGKLLGRGIGTFFALSTILTLIEISSFVSLVQHTLRITTGFAHGLAILVLVFELGSGIALCCRIFPRTSSFLLLGTIGFMILLQFLCLITKGAITYNSFGILNRLFSDYQITLILLIASNILILFASSFHKQASIPSPIVLVITLFFLVFCDVLLLKGYKHFEAHHSTHSSDIVAVINQSALKETLNDTVSVFFLLQHNDFNCPPCLESVLELGYRLFAVLPPQHHSRVVAFMCEDEVIFNQNRAQHWKTANNFPFDVLFVPKSLFTQFHIKKSCVVVIQNRQKVIFQQDAPFTLDTMKKIESILL